MEKERTYRDRSKRPQPDPKETIHPVHRPYERDHTNLTKRVIEEYSDFDDEVGYPVDENGEWTGECPHCTVWHPPMFKEDHNETDNEGEPSAT